MQKESVRCILIKIKCFFSNFKEFYNEQGYISYFNFIFCFHKFNTFPHIRSFPIIRFNICFFSKYIYCDLQVSNQYCCFLWTDRYCKTIIVRCLFITGSQWHYVWLVMWRSWVRAPSKAKRKSKRLYPYCLVLVGDSSVMS